MAKNPSEVIDTGFHRDPPKGLIGRFLDIILGFKERRKEAEERRRKNAEEFALSHLSEDERNKLTPEEKKEMVDRCMAMMRGAIIQYNPHIVAE